MLATTIAPMFFGLVTLLVAAVRAGVAQLLGADRGRRRLDAARSPPAPGSSRPPPAPSLIGVALIPIGVQVARMSDQAWAERPASSAPRARRRRRWRSRAPPDRGDGGRPRARAPASVTPAGSSSSPHAAYQPSSAAWSTSGWNWTPHARRPTRKPSARPPSRPCVDLDGAGRRLDAVLVPVQGVGVRRERAEHRVVGDHLDRRPGDEAAFAGARPRRRARGPAVARPGRRRGTGSRARPPRGSARPRARTPAPTRTSRRRRRRSRRPRRGRAACPKCSRTAPSGAAALPRKGCCR